MPIGVSEYDLGPDDGVYDFYKCYLCGKPFSRDQERARLKKGRKVCPCGSSKYSPGWPVGLQWASPGIALYVAKLVVARGIRPWLMRRLGR
jgi:DNA-directed RNA polymerase subunit RPC12/RpoP